MNESTLHNENELVASEEQEQDIKIAEEASSEETETTATTDAEPLQTDDHHIPTIPQLCVALAILLMVFSAPYVSAFMHHTKLTAQANTQPSVSTPQAALLYKTGVFDTIEIKAESAYVWDVALQRALFNKNAHVQLPLASLTKLMTALVAYETTGTDATVAISSSAIHQEGESGFKKGEVWKAKDLLDFTLMTSSNDGAYALAGSAGAALLSDNLTPEASFVRAMNKKAEEIGLTQTYFTNPTGLDASQSQSGSYGSARDMAFLMEYVVRHKPELLEKTKRSAAVFSDTGGTRFAATNTNQEISSLDNPIGSKTGYTVLAGGNLVIAFNIGLDHPIIVSVLGSSREGRFSDVQKLIEGVKESYIPISP